MLDHNLLHYLINNSSDGCREGGETKALATSALEGSIVPVLAVDMYGVLV